MGSGSSKSPTEDRYKQPSRTPRSSNQPTEPVAQYGAWQGEAPQQQRQQQQRQPPPQSQQQSRQQPPQPQQQSRQQPSQPQQNSRQQRADEWGGSTSTYWQQNTPAGVNMIWGAAGSNTATTQATRQSSDPTPSVRSSGQRQPSASLTTSSASAQHSRTSDVAAAAKASYEQLLAASRAAVSATASAAATTSALAAVTISRTSSQTGARSTQSSSPLAPTTKNPAKESDEAVRSCCRFRLQDLELATSNFSAKNLIGEGGFGKVFKGKLMDGTMIAVKQLDPMSLQGDREFYAEVALLMRLRHPNLVSMMGMSIEDGARNVVFEYMEKGSLRDILDKRPATLNWKERVGVALGAARGLAYLHCITQPAVVHCDFKAANVLIDNHGDARVADFGLARHIGVRNAATQASEGAAASGHNEMTIVTSVRGTFGYLSPEYLEKGHASVLADVFAFGVVLLELLTGKQAIDASRGRGLEGLADWMRPKLKDTDNVVPLLDPALKQSPELPLISLVALCEVALGCSQAQARDRPNMLEVVRTLDAALQHCM